MPAISQFEARLAEVRAEAARRRNSIVQVLSHSTQPLVAVEIAYVMNVPVTNIRKLLAEMVTDGKISTRQETPDERRARYGGAMPKAICAQLFSMNSPVPLRTSAVAVSGCVATVNNPKHHMSSSEIDRRVFNALKNRTKKHRFTIGSLAKSAGVAYEASRSRVKRLVGANAIILHSAVEQSHVYRVLDTSKLRDALNQPNTEQLELPTPAVPPVPVVPKEKVTVTTAESTPADDTVPVSISELKQLNDEIMRLRDEIKTLRERPTTVSLADLINGRG